MHHRSKLFMVLGICILLLVLAANSERSPSFCGMVPPFQADRIEIDCHKMTWIVCWTSGDGDTYRKEVAPFDDDDLLYLSSVKGLDSIILYIDGSFYNESYWENFLSYCPTSKELSISSYSTEMAISLATINTPYYSKIVLLCNVSEWGSVNCNELYVNHFESVPWDQVVENSITINKISLSCNMQDVREMVLSCGRIKTLSRLVCQLPQEEWQGYPDQPLYPYPVTISALNETPDWIAELISLDVIDSFLSSGSRCIVFFPIIG